MRYVPGLLLAFAVLAAVAPAEEISSEEVADLLDELVDRDPYVRKLAEKRLRELGPLVVPDLIEALSGKSRNVRIASARVLGAIGPKAKGAVPALVRATEQRTDAVLRHQAALALEKIDPDGALRAPGGTGETSLPPESTASPEALIPLLASKDPKTRLEAARALGELGPKAKTAVPALLAAGDEGDPNVARAMLSAIGRIAPKDPAAVRAVWRIAQKGPTDRRRAALGALASIGEPAAEVVFSDYARTAHRTAPEALWTIGARAVPVLVSAQGLSSDAKETSIAACRALGFLGTNGAGAVPRLGSSCAACGRRPWKRMRTKICRSSGSSRPCRTNAARSGEPRPKLWARSAHRPSTPSSRSSTSTRIPTAAPVSRPRSHSVQSARTSCGRTSAPARSTTPTRPR